MLKMTDIIVPASRLCCCCSRLLTAGVQLGGSRQLSIDVRRNARLADIIQQCLSATGAVAGCCHSVICCGSTATCGDEPPR